MRERIRAGAAIALLLAAAPLAAQTKDGDWPVGSAMEVGARYVKTRDYFARLLEAQQKALLGLVAPLEDQRLSAGLEAQHAKWLEYRDAECEVFGALTGAGGSWPSTYAVNCEARLTEHRYHSVRSAAACLRKVAPQKRADEVSRCLQQLLPLNLK